MQPTGAACIHHCCAVLCRAAGAIVCFRFLPKATQIIGYARTQMSLDEFHQRLAPYIKGDPGKVKRFLQLCTYMHGDVSIIRSLLLPQRTCDHASCA